MRRTYIGLGSNQQQPAGQLQQALRALAAIPQSRLQACSRLYRSRPLGPQDQPDFINAVAVLDTALPPLELLDALQAIEAAQGRVRTRHWGPRTLDLDLLLYGNEQMDGPRLTLPHPGLVQRNFVLVPLAELAPDLVLPDGQKLADLLPACGTEGLQVLDAGHHQPGVLS